MSYIEAHQSVWTHRKTLALADALDIDDLVAAAHMLKLWSWALDNTKDGSLADVTDRVIARSSSWNGDTFTFVQAMIDVGFMDSDRMIHNWDMYGGKLTTRRSKDVQRLRERRERERTQDDRSTQTRTTAGQPPDNQRTTAGSLEQSSLEQSSLEQSRAENSTGLPVADTADAAPPPKITRPKMIKASGNQTDVTVTDKPAPAPKTNRVAEVIDALKAINPDAPCHISARDGAAIKQSGAAPTLIAEAFNAAYTGEWGDTWMQDNLSLQLVITRLPGYETHVKAPPKPKGGQTAVNLNGNREAQEKRYGTLSKEEVAEQLARMKERQANAPDRTLTPIEILQRKNDEDKRRTTPAQIARGV